MRILLIALFVGFVFGRLILPDSIPGKNGDSDPTFIPEFDQFSGIQVAPKVPKWNHDGGSKRG